MIVIDEITARRLVSAQDAIDAIDQVFREISRERARNFPVVRERLAPGPDVYGIKSGSSLAAGLLGLKIGGYWPGNQGRGLTNHQSTTVLTDPQTGCPAALVSSNHLTGLRTAAASAIGIRELARRDARVLGIVGAGAQARFHIEAALLVRDFDRILVASRDEGRAAAFAGSLADNLADNLDGRAEVAAAGIEAVVRQADVLITLTPAREPVVRAGWVRAGTHICAMGADTAGKQEIDTDLMLRASVWVDDWVQASSIGECQHAAKRGLTREGIRGTLCDRLEGRAEGRGGDEEVTVFDSTGMAVQDLAVAARALQAVRDSGDEAACRIDLAR